ncbi:uncharacterized protein LOC105641803 isoform X2 [Jatropha curcas]|uniref:uncharacterized protein LOC105641803 isoform X2 n=1 Tax=Jatropha curcas TaxID=180498 RepID=UPI0005FC2669|nr:uncharacterized protein LOC105641803 isoform X2 [Jatropha curcas]XP_012081809.1 uncharacterized protein LOC105641803 isoform X2 [Jatropha curcas]XP_012081810.1 uncharacterized protein LOC105641803 isoform X2 [Jatropha curcas]XP_037493601.1 uncharacterized protein LOC105641803 isoform X2 [Jatropha curcas]
MADNGRVHPDCVNAANPYHECGVACLEKIAQGHVRQPKKKSGSFKASLSFGKKSKGSDSQPMSPQSNNISAVKAVRPADSMTPRSPFSDKKVENNNIYDVKPVYPADSMSPRSPFPNKKKVESENSQSSSSSRQHSDESYSQDHSFDKGQVPSSEYVPTSGNLTSDGPKNRSISSFTCFAIAPPTKQEENQEVVASPEAAASPTAEDAKVKRAREALSLTFSGISRASEESSDGEVQSVISDSCVSVGKYHVRSNFSAILQQILEKYGDIAANCRLESTSLRTYYLECLCSVVQELQSTSLNQLTKSKVKEMLAVLKDVESAQIDVSWLRSILNGLTEAVELNNQQQAAEEAKTNCDCTIESMRKELESMTDDLAKKEKAIADTKAQIEETKARLSKLELESAQFSDTISAIKSKVEKFHLKPLADQIL